jgi:hypothetical protein
MARENPAGFLRAIVRRVSFSVSDGNGENVHTSNEP